MAPVSKERLAVVLFNLGGPDRPEAVEPFLFNLFSDRAILGIPQPFRSLLAKVIAKRRAPFARENYAKIGGASPLLRNTEAQAEALRESVREDFDTRVFIAMRYWKPFAKDAAEGVKAFEPDRIVLAPLYPQFSATTTGSSLADWRRAAEAAGLGSTPSRLFCCYFDDKDFIAAHAAILEAALRRADAAKLPAWRVLFSAHGLPERVIEKGDPYQDQIEETAAAIARAVRGGGFDWRVCYQSRVGPVKWIGPSTEDEIARAGAEGAGLVVVPLAFVSEHVETLVELDIDYQRLARESGVPYYDRAPALGANKRFIEGLARLVRSAAKPGEDAVLSCEGARRCGAAAKACPNQKRKRTS
jgi:ferrochelatase